MLAPTHTHKLTAKINTYTHTSEIKQMERQKVRMRVGFYMFQAFANAQTRKYKKKKKFSGLAQSFSQENSLGKCMSNRGVLVL